MQSRLKNTHYIYFICVATLIVYWKTIHYSFLPLDDIPLIKEKLIFFTNPANIRFLFTSPLYGDEASLLYRPILNLTYMLDAIIGGGSEKVFHLSNIMYHIISVVLVHKFLISFSYSKKLAISLTAIFALHPLNVHAIAWISGRNDILLALIVLLSLITFNKFILNEKYYWFIITIFLVFASLFVKENAIILIVLLISFLSYYQLEYSRNILIISSLSFILLTAILIRNQIVNNDLTFIDFTIIHISQDALFILTNYIGKFFIPIKFSVLPHLSDMGIYPGLISVLIISFVIFLTDRMSNTLFFIGILWFFLFLIIPIFWGLTTGIGEFYEHRMYVPSIGILLSISQLKLKIPSGLLSKICKPLLISIIVIFTIISVHRTKLYSDFNNFSLAAINESPTLARSFNLRGQYFHESGKFDSALAHYNHALDLNNNLYKVFNSRGALKLEKGLYEYAIEDFTSSIKLNPNFSEAHYNRGLAFSRYGVFKKSLKDYNAAIALSPSNASYYNNRGYTFEQLNDLSSALDDYKKAIALLPGNQIISDNINTVLHKLREHEKINK